MKDGIIEQLDTPANIVLNPATEYVRKFTEDVPREKVLKIESVMDALDSSEELSDLKVSKDAIIETVAEEVLGQEKPVAVIDSNKKVVGVLHRSHVIKCYLEVEERLNKPILYQLSNRRVVSLSYHSVFLFQLHRDE